MKYTLIFLSFLVFASCKTPKPSFKSEVTKVDSVKINKTLTIFAPVASSLTINDLCDTLTGKARSFKSEFVRGKDTIYIEVAGNALKMSIDLDSIREVISKEERFKFESNKKEEIIVKTKAPKWAWIALISIVIFIVLPSVPKFLNGISYKVWRLFFL